MDRLAGHVARAAIAAFALSATWGDCATPALSAGDRHSVALHADGTVRAWGNDAGGELGTRLLFSGTAAAVAGLAPASQIAAGRLHTLVRHADGTISAWGYNAVGPLGDGTATNRARPVKTLLTGVVDIVAGGHQSFARKADGSLWAWGGNGPGTLGDGSFTDRWSPVQAGISNVAGVATGFSHTVAVKSDGTVWTWGSNVQGELGTGPGPARATPAQVAGFTGIVAVAAPITGAFSAALKQDGTVWTWGSNISGQLGDGTTTGRALPAQVPGLTNVVAIAAGYLHMLALKGDGTVWAWGDNYVGSLGDGTRVSHSTPAKVLNLPLITKIAAGDGHDLAIAADGSLWSWGGNEYGQIGDGTTAMRLTPAQVASVGNVVGIAAGGGHSVVLKSDGSVLIWGSNLSGILGDGAPITRTVPLPVALANVVAINSGSGGDANLVVRSDGTLWGWGSNFCGQLGDGTYTTRSTPAPVLGLANVVAAASGACHSLALGAEGGVYSWGSGVHGELGNGSTVGYPSPARITGLTATHVAAGLQHSVAIATGGTVWTWGSNNHGQIGDGTTLDRLSPVQVSGLANVVAISAGGYHTLAVKGDGTVWAWGANFAGQIGDGTTTDRLLPVQVAGLASVVAVANGFNRSVALKADGTVWSWGDATGLTATFNSPTPIQVAGLQNAVRVACGNYHSIVATSDGSVWSWGDNAFGHLGDGTYVSRLAPVVVLADGGAGAVDANNWYLDLEPAIPSTIPAASTPKVVAVAQVAGSDDRLDLDSRVKYKAADAGRSLNTYVLALVPPGFFDIVATAPGASTSGELKARMKAGEALVLAQLTPQGWTDVRGQLIAYAQGVGNSLGGAASILNGVNGTLIPGSKFCIGYGESADAMLSSQGLREVLLLEGASANASGLPCVLSGVYVSGPPSSNAGTSVTFKATVVGLSPTGNVQFKDWLQNLSSPVALHFENAAVASASAPMTLGAGVHSVGAHYSGDGQNVPADTASPLVHTVVAAAGGTSTSLSGPASSQHGSEVVFAAAVTGNNPSGNVQLVEGASTLATAPVVEGVATFRIATLAVGSHVLKAAYTGDSGNAASNSGNLAHTVYGALSTTVALASSSNPSVSGTAVTFTATVGGNNPTGTVTFIDGAVAIGSAPLVGASASLTVSGLAPGVHSIRADYGGDASNQVASSGVLFQSVNTAASDATPNAFAFASLSNVAPGATVTSSLVTVSGIDAATPILVSGGAYSIGCGATFTAAPGAVTNGQTVCVRHTASADFEASTSTSLTIGGVSAAFTSTTHSAAFQSGVASLVTHYYTTVLRRAPDAPGQAFWASEAVRMTGIGANVNEAFYAMAAFFYTSAEYLAFNRTNSEFVTDLYNTFFNRAPDGPGLAYWTGQIGQGMPREVVLASFMFSAEFASFTQAIFGNTAARAEVDVVLDFYRGLLARLPDAGGSDYWVRQFRSAQCAGGGAAGAVYTQVESISSLFANGSEYTGRSRTNAQYVGDLYNAFLRRGGDLDGVQFWINQLNTSAMTRDQVRQQFIGSGEFTGRVNAIISQGCLS